MYDTPFHERQSVPITAAQARLAAEDPMGITEISQNEWQSDDRADAQELQRRRG